MALNFPTAAELRDEQALNGSSGIPMRSRDSSWNVNLKDTVWSVKLKDDDGIEPADVHGA